MGPARTLAAGLINGSTLIADAFWRPIGSAMAATGFAWLARNFSAAAIDLYRGPPCTGPRIRTGRACRAKRGVAIVAGLRDGRHARREIVTLRATQAVIFAAVEHTLAWDDDHERRARLLLLGKDGMNQGPPPLSARDSRELGNAGALEEAPQ